MSSPVPALRTGLVAEHAAIYLLGVLASRTSTGALADALASAYVAHRTVRDTLIERLSALGDTKAPGAAPAYDLPDGLADGLADESGVRAAALVLEQRATAGYGDLVAATSGEDRRRAIAWLSAASLRQLAFGGSPSELPGL